MDGLQAFSIPLKGLRTGVRSFRYAIGRAFFDVFEHSPIRDGKIEVQVELEKQPGMLILHFDFAGTVKTECDRCLANIDLPVEGRERLLVKFGEEDPASDPEVAVLPLHADVLNLGEFIYEFIILSVPMIKTYDCESADPRPCDLKMLRYLGSETENEAGDEGKTEGGGSIWDQLREQWKDSN